MAIVKMKFVEASTDRDHLDSMLLKGIGSGMLDVEPASNIVTEDNGGKMISEENPYADYRQTLQNFAHAVGFSFDPDRKPSRTYSKEEIEKFLGELNEKFGITSDAGEVILTPDDEKALDALSVCGFERIHACNYLNFGFGRMPRESFPKLSAYRDVNFVHHRLHENKQYIWMVYVTSDSYAEEVAKIFQSLYFEPMEIPPVDVHRLLHQYEDQLNDIFAYCSQRNEIISQYKYVSIFDEKYLLSGFVQASQVQAYEDAFNGEPVTFTVKEPEDVPQFKCPTLLKNNWFAKPFELFVDMYSTPAYGDFDPTFFLAVTYCILFGIMFGDMGQGIILMIIGFLFEKKGKLFGIIGRVGITSSIMGFLFGSVFGYEDLLNPIHQKLFHVREKLFDVMANSNTMTLLIGALIIGVVLIVCSMTINIVNNLRHKKPGEVLFSQNGIAGLVFYLYVIIAAGLKLMGGANLFHVQFVIPFILVPVFCFLMKEPLTNLVTGHGFRASQSWGAYILQNFFEVFEILLSFVTNSMSYLRVGGFVLSHAGMMLVVMTLVKMTGNAGPLVLVFGNIFVMALEGLVVGIQALRLEYYEMFSRYYTGGGRKYKALTAQAE
ncbi:MAG: V-type ATPase 116kDa subunit family protein [Lactimicrobium massiliense]|nr:V-type ATPase 116kDa subunit family protein [Lactimicrobium massiliense]MDD6560426.1 V-type ATPase 116kDa subunit family protein [Lactimicrobium massiliense]MDD6674513.1 V-type ATPase 116kDa subunit family protein [Lactimicrobium massiliense]MDD6726647.1 V-type ATPase 116kDa subunit family protein [Lactimicrobium massiliense]